MNAIQQVLRSNGTRHINDKGELIIRYLGTVYVINRSYGCIIMSSYQESNQRGWFSGLVTYVQSRFGIERKENILTRWTF